MHATARAPPRRVRSRALSTPSNKRRPNAGGTGTAAGSTARPSSTSAVPPAVEPLADAGTEAGFSLPPLEVDASDPSVRFEVGALASQGPGRMARLAAGWKTFVDRTRRVVSVLSVAGLVAGASVGGRYAHRWVTTTPRFGARDIAVEGLGHTTRDDALRAAGISEGTNVLGLDTHRAERALLALPWVERAHVSRRLPGSVRVEIEERRAAAVVSSGGLYLCAPDGTIFKRVTDGDAVDLPTITGISRADFARDADTARENVRDALALLSDFEGSSLSGRVRVEEVHRDPTGDLALVLSDQHTYVWLGRGGYRAKLARLSAILGELSRHELHAAEIHLESDRHPERATVRLPTAQSLALVDPELVPAAREVSSRASEGEGPAMEVHRRARRRFHLQTRPAPRR